MTEAEKKAYMETLYNKSVRELVEMIVQLQDDMEEYKQIRKRFKQILNLLKDPEDRKKPGRPKKQDI